jgi:hypothetical protein
MSDFILIVTVVAFFAIASLIVRACSSITDGSVDRESDVLDGESERGVPA